MHQPPEITSLIHENFWIILSFALARPVATKLLNEKFHGEWKQLRKTIYETAEKRADRALLEMATQLRVLDDMEHINERLMATKHDALGTVVQGDGTTTDLFFRDMTNKVIHGAGYEWLLNDPENPVVVCHTLRSGSLAASRHTTSVTDGAHRYVVGISYPHAYRCAFLQPCFNDDILDNFIHMSPETIGEQRVRRTFNPSASSDVDIIKNKCAKLIDLCEGLKQRDGRLASLAQTAFEEAAMWAVKAATA